MPNSFLILKFEAENLGSWGPFYEGNKDPVKDVFLWVTKYVKANRETEVATSASSSKDVEEIKVKDVRALLLNVSDCTTTILRMRRGCLLISLPSISAIILKDRCLVIVDLFPNFETAPKEVVDETLAVIDKISRGLKAWGTRKAHAGTRVEDREAAVEEGGVPGQDAGARGKRKEEEVGGPVVVVKASTSSAPESVAAAAFATRATTNSSTSHLPPWFFESIRHHHDALKDEDESPRLFSHQVLILVTKVAVQYIDAREHDMLRDSKIVTDRLHAKTSQFDKLQGQLRTLQNDISKHLQVLMSLKVALEDFQNGDEESDTHTPGGIETEEIYDELCLYVENRLANMTALNDSMDRDARSCDLKLAAARYSTSKISMFIQLLTACISTMSVVSGYFGMNLDNGICGPEGCHGLEDSGHGGFLMVSSISAAFALIMLIVSWYLIKSKVVA